MSAEQDERAGFTTRPWEEAAESICAAVERRMQSTIKRAADALYDDVMTTAQDYLSDNVNHNLKSKLSAARSSARTAHEQASVLKAQRDALRAIVMRYMGAYPAFRMKPIGEPGSPKRIEQEKLMALEDAARAALSKATTDSRDGADGGE